MENFNYQKITSDLISELNERQKEIIGRRFGLNRAERETLESIGQDFGICRERVRQIEEVALEKIKSKVDKYQTFFQSVLQYLRKFGNLRKEDILLAELGKDRWKNEVYFLLSLKEPFKRKHEDDDFYSFWLTDQNALLRAKKVIDSLSNQLQKVKKPLKFNELNPALPFKKEPLISYLEISKKIQKNEEGFYGLKNWPEINPRGVKDKAYLIFKKLGKPLHFTQVANFIEGSHLQTVHNELIRDPRFVLVGRGTYALAEWGYYPGQVKDVIFKILQQAKKPLRKEEILEAVSKQRFVKENTILLNLSNKQYFLRDPKGKYRIKTELI